MIIVYAYDAAFSVKEGTMSLNSERPAPRVAMLSYHTCPLAKLGGQKTGGMNVYVRDFSQALADTGMLVDVTRLQLVEPVVNHELGQIAG
jgi:hypothetical protein